MEGGKREREQWRTDWQTSFTQECMELPCILSAHLSWIWKYLVKLVHLTGCPKFWNRFRWWPPCWTSYRAQDKADTSRNRPRAKLSTYSALTTTTKVSILRCPVLLVIYLKYHHIPSSLAKHKLPHAWSLQLYEWILALFHSWHAWHRIYHDTSR